MTFTHSTVLEKDRAKPIRAILGSDVVSVVRTTVSSPTSPIPTSVDRSRCNVAVAHTSRRMMTLMSKVSPMVNSRSVTPMSLRGCSSLGAM